jgi:hypothetical protein
MYRPNQYRPVRPIKAPEAFLKYFLDNGLIKQKDLDDSGNPYAVRSHRSIHNATELVERHIRYRLLRAPIVAEGEVHENVFICVTGLTLEVDLLESPLGMPAVVAVYQRKKEEPLFTKIPIGETPESVEETRRQLFDWIASNDLPVHVKYNGFARAGLLALDPMVVPPRWTFQVTDTRCWKYRQLGVFVVSPDDQVVQILTRKRVDSYGVSVEVGHAYLFGDLEAHIQPEFGKSISESTKLSNVCPILRYSHADGHMIGVFQGNEWRFLEKDLRASPSEQTAAYVDFIETVIRTAAFE